jgi:hypothetical protein
MAGRDLITQKPFLFYRLREKKRAGLFGTPAQAEKPAKPAKA